MRRNISSITTSSLQVGKIIASLREVIDTLEKYKSMGINVDAGIRDVKTQLEAIQSMHSQYVRDIDDITAKLEQLSKAVNV
jgi:prefoldin subunit 5